MKRKILLFALLAAGLCLLATAPAEALQFGFEDLETMKPMGRFVDVVDLTPTGSGVSQVLFSFEVTDSDAPISHIYFEDKGDVLSDLRVQNQAGVFFVEHSPQWDYFPVDDFETDFSVGFLSYLGDAAKLQVGESLGILFTLQDGSSYDDIVSALQGGQLRIGVSGTEPLSMNSTGDTSPVPEPSTLLLFGAGLICVTAARQRFRRREKTKVA